ncbi:lipoyltransferase 1, mitochondrial-like [Physella acuta]|uniref:lipoyltransferase 1, mitochondrial-like n=1 Tax=Physella acuta TaxID=109671 RepID=UPI0027DB47D0|nr:lipoyltransferase 1, mitochondrial-like [Physella acuta]
MQTNFTILQRLHSILSHTNISRRLCTSHGSQLKRLVLISKSKSIFHNLALEEWMYENKDFADVEYLLLWKNRPTVVFGRHQNPWLEANVSLATKYGVDISRRSSGGGTVYHDEGNLNLSFLTSRARYNRKANLNLVVDALTARWDLDLTVNDRDDIMLEKFYKVSGTAAKLGRVQSYHHFTLLVDVDQQKLLQCLTSVMQGADSKATRSSPASVRNLIERAPDMTFESLVEVIGQNFLHKNNEQVNSENYRWIDPVNEEDYPGISEIVARLESWQWVYGKTPAFSIFRAFVGHFNSKPCTLKISITVEKGNLTSLIMEVDRMCDDLQDLMETMQKYYLSNLNSPSLTRENIENLQTGFELYVLAESGSNETVFVQWVSNSIKSCFSFL